MCGICGFYSRNEYSEDILGSMTDSIHYRGPDDRGALIYKSRSDRHVGMGHRRLSIMDLTEAGHQPMVSDDGRYSLVFNGEIYNFTDLRDQMEQSGISFSSRCDTEVVLKAYMKYGTDCFGMFNGMFAIAIYD